MYATYVVKELAGIEPWTLRNSIMSCALYQLSYQGKCRYFIENSSKLVLGEFGIGGFGIR